ncbi:hypothetical protein KFU94_17695 [Chloroflexi bacterium TSY]|nr:hypothetical protein [Chloroflexi bacterium TSY]
MRLLQKLFGKKLDGERLATSDNIGEYAQIDLLSRFVEPNVDYDHLTRQRWTRVLPQDYAQTLELFVRQDWLELIDSGYQLTADGQSIADKYQERLAMEKNAVLPKVRAALQDRETGLALEIRRSYEARQPLGKAVWTGPEPQMSHSALTRRILFLEHWLLDGYDEESAEWLRLYAAEQHMWGAYWRLSSDDIPNHVKQALVEQRSIRGVSSFSTPQAGSTEFDAAETVYWRAYQLALYVDNQETWQRCSGGDHVRRLEIVVSEDHKQKDASLCNSCSEIVGKQFLVARVPDLPLRECTCPQGCLCRYEPVLEMYEEL